MARPKFIEVAPQPLERYRDLLGPEYPTFERVAERAKEAFAGKAIWHVNSTHRGGGVAEMLRSLLPYVRGVGVDTRWVVLREKPEFFVVTKRLHNNLHGDPGDGGELGEEEREVYEETLKESARYLTRLLQPGDVVYLHDPQTAGLVPAVRDGGVKVVWRCHIGVDEPNELVRRAWDFLRPYVETADAYVFSRRQYFWDGLDDERLWVVPPSVDPFSPKNQEMAPETVEAIVGEDRARPPPARGGARLHPGGRDAGAGRAPCRDPPGGAAAARREAGRPGLPLGQAEGPPRGARVLRGAPRRPRGAPGPRRAGDGGGLRRPRGRRGVRDGRGGLAPAAGGGSPPRSPGQPADVRPRRERRDGQRDTASLRT